MKIVSATDAKNRLGALIASVARDNEDVIIENHGTPRAALISYEAYRELLSAREARRRSDAMEGLRQLRKEVRQRNQVLDDGAADVIADEVSRAAIGRVLSRDRVSRADLLE